MSRLQLGDVVLHECGTCDRRNTVSDLLQADTYLYSYHVKFQVQSCPFHTHILNI